jgi:hypothetical protein
VLFYASLTRLKTRIASSNKSDTDVPTETRKQNESLSDFRPHLSSLDVSNFSAKVAILEATSACLPGPDRTHTRLTEARGLRLHNKLATSPETSDLH